MKKVIRIALVLFAVMSISISCKKENSKRFVGKYTADQVEFDTKILTSAAETVDLPVVTLKNVSLDLKEGTENNLVTGELKFSDVRGDIYHIIGECSGNEVVFDDVTVNLNDIHTTNGDVTLELVLSCVGTLKSKALYLTISYGGVGSITNNGVTHTGEIFESVINKVKFAKQGSSGNNSNHAHVDLGLPSGTLWATCNVGANSPEEYGDYFAWGETEPKEVYAWGTYKYANGYYSLLTKYCQDPDYGNDGYTDFLTILQSEDDAATVNWGSSWRMPTYAEVQELNDYCAVTEDTLNGIRGQRYTASNGNSIFLPAAGIRDIDELDGAGGLGYYWSSSLDTDGPDEAMNLYYSLPHYYMYYCSVRYFGFSVRPVRSSHK